MSSLATVPHPCSSNRKSPCLQVVVDWAFAQGWGLSACWFSTATFMALRLLMNSVRLLGPGSVLSRTEALSDKMEDLEGKAAALAAAVGTSLADTESDASDSDAGTPPLTVPPAASAALATHGDPAASRSGDATAGTTLRPADVESLSLTELNTGRGVDARPGGRARVEWSWDAAAASVADDLAMIAEEGGEPGGDRGTSDPLGELGRPGGRARGGGGGVLTSDVLNPLRGKGLEEANARTSAAAVGADPRAGSSAVGALPEGGADAVQAARSGVGSEGRPGGRARGEWPGGAANVSIDDDFGMVAEEGGGPGADIVRRDVIGELGRPGGRARGGGGGGADALTSEEGASTHM